MTRSSKFIVSPMAVEKCSKRVKAHSQSLWSVLTDLRVVGLFTVHDV